jgi:formylglycine-generating enzyme required for sulfatase activity
MGDPNEQEPRKPTAKPLNPLPRLWKSGSDSPDGEAGSSGADRIGDKSQKDAAEAASTASSKPSKRKSKSTKEKLATDGTAKGEKKVLLEETPAFDTYETRRRARLLIGGLSAVCAGLVGWIVYRTFIYDPSPIDNSSDDMALATSVPERSQSLEQEARFLFNRAHESAKLGRTDQAISILNRVVKVYKGTPTAEDAKVALERPKQNLPLFTDRPVVVAEPKAAAPPPAPAAPPAVVDVSPDRSAASQGEAVLVLPANPAEAAVVPPSQQPKVSVAARPLPAGFQPNLEAGIHDSGWPLVIVGDRDGAPMVLVPGGTFMMGNNEGQAAEKPAHQVRLSAYYVDQHEVTNRQFRTFLHETRYHGSPAGKWLTDVTARAEPENLPVVRVNLHDAEAFAAWAGKQLPTEAQWELAGRSTDGRRFPWGDEPANGSQARTANHIDPVLSFPEDRSPYGVFDMGGNVREWTTDWFDSRYYYLFAKQVADNPLGPNTRPRSLQAAVRGAAKDGSVTYREGVPIDKRLPNLGFRCVLIAVGAAPAGTPAAPPTQPAAAQPGQQNQSAVPF